MSEYALESKMRELLAVMIALREQVYQMRGMFHDRDGSIQRAIDEFLQAEQAAIQVLEALNDLLTFLDQIQIDKDCHEAMNAFRHFLAVEQPACSLCEHDRSACQDVGICQLTRQEM